ncbi:MAG: molybdopterin-synthase adenylyltransferase MoeB [Deltaproteobacteria bacterium]|nr:molybdopterin-synthase adenylyltransferase MoeB [Deltaproteobacteria bacterium]MCW5808729.1 molybdopterin-synthase adenylyltransferase MoeB [Deltaproteobacteria bacterium]
MPSFDTLLREIRGKTIEIEVAALERELLGAGPALIDVREPDENAQGMIPGTTHIPRGFLELRIERAVPDREAPVVVYCASGTRSVLAARSLVELGYTNVRSLAGGFTGWKRAGLPWEQPLALRPDQEARYSRHTLIPEVGVGGQLKLLKAKVLCIGAGGLGSPSSMYLAAAGVGRIGVIDDDVVDASNLQRQILHATDRVGTPKVDSAEATLRGLNPDVVVDKHRTRITSENALALIGGYDVVIDGADNFATRYLVNDCALRLGKPVVHASIFRFEGQITVFPANGAPCYRCLYPQPPPAEEAPSCAEAGVLGVLPGIMGVLQATEAIKLVLGLGDTLAGRLLVYDALKTRFRELKLRRDPKCPTCGDGVERAAIPLIDYEQFCRGPAH